MTRRGLVPFAPADLIAEVRRMGSSYPDTTLRTFIVGPMCANSPNNHAVQYNDLVRVGHGQYRLLKDDEAEQLTKVPVFSAPIDHVVVTNEPDPDQAAGEWFWEGNVQATVVRHLASDGWTIRRVADTASSEQGVDVLAVRGGERVLVEVKGYPSTVYARGPRAGQSKPTPPALQARQYFSHALLSGLIMREKDTNARVALAFPDLTTYRTLAERTWEPLRSAGIELWLVTEAGLVSEEGLDHRT